MRNFEGHTIVVIVVCLAVAPADAQTVSNAPRTFVAVTVGPDWDDTRKGGIHIPGATWRSGIAFGMDWGRSGVEVDVGVPQWHVKNRGPDRYRFAGPSFGWQQQGHLYESSSTVRRRSIDVTVMFRVNRPINRHLAFNWLVGGGFVYRPEQESRVVKEVLPDGQRIEVNAHKGTSSRNYVAGTTGFDAEVRVTRHLSVVPRLRVLVFPSVLDTSGLAPRMVTARPEIAARWRF